jgi:hypothetical protein
MQQIEEYFNHNILSCKNILMDNKLFEIENENIFELFININTWANDVETTNERHSRENKQNIFSNFIKQRDKRCVITGKYNILECEACHIVPVKMGGSYNIDNGLLINLIHHKTFDDNLWSINPENMCVDILTQDINIVGSIIDYEGKNVNIKPTHLMKHYLTKKWDVYIQLKYDYYKSKSSIQ